MPLIFIFSNQQGSSGNQGYSNQGAFRQGGNYSGGRQGGGDQWNRKRRHDGGGQGGYSKMQRNGKPAAALSHSTLYIQNDCNKGIFSTPASF